MKISFIKISLIILFTGIVLFGQYDKPKSSEGSLKFYVDVSIFMENENEIRMEFSIMLYSDQLQSNIKNKNVEYKAFLKITNENTNIERNWETEAGVNNPENSVFNSMVVTDSWSEIISNADYNYELMISDINSGAEGICLGKIESQNYNDYSVTISNIKFFTGYNNSNSKLELSPHASRQFGFLNPLMYVHFEIYKNKNLSPLEAEINYNIKNADDDIIKSFPAKIQKIDNDKIKITNALNVSSIPTGVYQLEAVIKASENKTEIIKESRSFEIIQFDKNANTDFENEEVIEFSKNIFSYIASENELIKYNSLSENGKIEFIYKFWNNNDKDNDQGKNEYLIDLYKKYIYSNENFSWGGIQGWKSDRGRVLIKYGIPDEITNYFAEENTNPYTIWKYEKDRASEFIFGDLRGNGRFLLIHSTKESEVSNSYWIESLVKAK